MVQLRGSPIWSQSLYTSKLTSSSRDLAPSLLLPRSKRRAPFLLFSVSLPIQWERGSLPVSPTPEAISRALVPLPLVLRASDLHSCKNSFHSCRVSPYC